MTCSKQTAELVTQDRLEAQGFLQPLGGGQHPQAPVIKTLEAPLPALLNTRWAVSEDLLS